MKVGLIGRLFNLTTRAMTLTKVPFNTPGSLSIGAIAPKIKAGRLRALITLTIKSTPLMLFPPKFTALRPPHYPCTCMITNMTVVQRARNGIKISFGVNLAELPLGFALS